MADELVGLKVDLILAAGQPARDAARKATATIPILTLSGSDPVREGWAQSLARPGRQRHRIRRSASPAWAEALRAAEGSDAGALAASPCSSIRSRSSTPKTSSARPRPVRGGSASKCAHRAGERRARIRGRVRRGAKAPCPGRGSGGRVTGPTCRGRRARLALPHGLDRRIVQEARDGLLLGYGVDLDDLVRHAVAKMDQILKGALAFPSSGRRSSVSPSISRPRARSA